MRVAVFMTLFLYRPFLTYMKTPCVRDTLAVQQPLALDLVTGAEGFAKTPDVLLTIPIGYAPPMSEGSSNRRLYVVNWIDSKAMFGAPAVYHNEHRQQLLAYVNRLGAGAVIYWFGFANELQESDNEIVLLWRWPEPGTLYWPDGNSLE